MSSVDSRVLYVHSFCEFLFLPPFVSCFSFVLFISLILRLFFGWASINKYTFSPISCSSLKVNKTWSWMHNYGDQKHLLSTYIDMVFVVKVKCYVSTDSLSLSQKQSVMSVQVHFLSQKQSVMSVHKQTFMSVQVHFLSQNKAVLQALFLLHCSNTLKHTSKRQDLFFFSFGVGVGGQLPHWF